MSKHVRKRFLSIHCVYIPVHVRLVLCVGFFSMFKPKIFVPIIYIYIYIQGDSGGICSTLGSDSMCDSKKKVHMNTGPILNGYRDMVKRNTDNPASANNYVINNITTNITCIQVLTIVLLMICNGQNPGSSSSGTFSKMPPPTSMHLWPRCRVLRDARRSSFVNYVHSKAFLTQFFTLATHGDSPFLLRCMWC